MPRVNANLVSKNQKFATENIGALIFLSEIDHKLSFEHSFDQIEQLPDLNRFSYDKTGI